MAAMARSNSAARGKDAALRERGRYDPAASVRAQGIQGIRIRTTARKPDYREGGDDGEQHGVARGRDAVFWELAGTPLEGVLIVPHLGGALARAAGRMMKLTRATARMPLNSLVSCRT